MSKKKQKNLVPRDGPMKFFDRGMGFSLVIGTKPRGQGYAHGCLLIDPMNGLKWNAGTAKKAKWDRRPQMIRLEIPREIESGNELKRWLWHPKTRYKYAALKKKFLRDIHIVALAAGVKLPMFPVKKHVVFERLIPKGGKEMDDDRLSMGFILVRDCLTDLGIIVNDSPKWLSETYRQTRSANGKGGVVLEIETKALL